MNEGNGKNLQRLHDICSQHLRVLKAMKYEPSGTFVTALLEMRLNQSTMFEWQRHTQGKADLPHFTDFLDFIDLRARASEAISHERQKCHSQTVPTKSSTQMRMTYATSTNINNSCIVCGASKHLLYTCRKFRLLLLEVVRKNQLCYNCLQPGHFKAAPHVTAQAG